MTPARGTLPWIPPDRRLLSIFRTGFRDGAVAAVGGDTHWKMCWSSRESLNAHTVARRGGSMSSHAR